MPILSGTDVIGGAGLSALQTWTLTPRFRARVQALAAEGGSAAVVEAPCALDAACPTPAIRQPTAVAGVSGHLIVTDDATVSSGTGGYYVFGLGAYRPLRSPSNRYAIGGAWELGVGVTFGGRDAPMFLEVKYVRIPHWIAGQWSFVPITLGISW